MQGGRSFGPYQVVGELGRGGMGVVYEVQHPDIPRRLALKVIVSPFASATILQRFGREAELLARIKHPGVVSVNHLGSQEGRPFLVMDFVAGRSLSALSREGPTPPPEAARIVRQVADAVQAVHDAGILHRDLKPDNVVLREEDQRPVLLDFGIARAVDVDRLTQSGQLLGSPGYMAPEQAEGFALDALDARTDVYGLGAILFFLLSGNPPFRGDSMINVIRAVLADEPDWPAEAPPELLSILRRAMAKDREQRHASAAALRDDLDAYLAGGQVAPQRRLGLFAAYVAVVVTTLIALAFAMTAADPPPPELEPEPVATDDGSIQTPEAVEQADRATPWIVLPHPGAPARVRARLLGPDSAVTWSEHADRGVGSVARWTFAAGRVRQLDGWDLQGSVEDVVVLADGTLLAASRISASDKRSRLTLLRPGAEPEVLRDRLPGRVRKVRPCPDLARLAVSFYEPREGSRVWILDGERDPAPLKDGPPNPTPSMIYEPRRQLLLVGSGLPATQSMSQEGAVHVWDLSEPEPALEFELPLHATADCLVVLEAGPPLRWVIGTPDGSLRVYEDAERAGFFSSPGVVRHAAKRSDNTENPFVVPRAHPFPPNALALTEDGRLYSLAGDYGGQGDLSKTPQGELRVFDLERRLLGGVEGWELTPVSLHVQGEHAVIGNFTKDPDGATAEVWPLKRIPTDGRVLDRQDPDLLSR